MNLTSQELKRNVNKHYLSLSSFYTSLVRLSKKLLKIHECVNHIGYKKVSFVRGRNRV